MSGDVSKVVAFLQEHAKYVDVRDKPMVFRAAELLAKLDAVTKDAEALRSDIREIYEEMPQLPITPETMDAATDVLTRFCIDFNAALTDQGRAGEGR